MELPPTPPPYLDPSEPPHPSRSSHPSSDPSGPARRSRATRVIAVGALGVGLALGGYAAAGAVSGQSTPSTAATNPVPDGPDAGARRGERGDRHGHLTEAATAMGISETDLMTALQSGQTLAQIAQAHNVDPQKVIDALVAAENTELDAAVTAGKLTQAEADQRKADLTQHITDEVNNGQKDHGGPGGEHGRGGGHLTEAATAMGISETDLMTALQSGQTLAQIAQAHNVDPQKVIDALVAAENTELDAAVTAGKLTQAEADQRKADLTQHITDEVNNGHKDHGGPGGPGGGRGPGRPGDHDADDVPSTDGSTTSTTGGA